MLEPGDPVPAGRFRHAPRRGHRRLWLAAGTAVIAAAAVVTGLLAAGSPAQGGRPAHLLVTPARIGTYVLSDAMEEQTGLTQLRDQVGTMSTGQADHVVSAVYESGSSAAQIIAFIGGHLAKADPPASAAEFLQKFPGARAVSAGSLGGDAVCTQEGAGTADAVAMCVWFDNDSFGEFVSPTMNATALAPVMRAFRPSVELRAAK
jgi:hypothetical protein